LRFHNLIPFLKYELRVVFDQLGRYIKIFSEFSHGGSLNFLFFILGKNYQDYHVEASKKALKAGKVTNINFVPVVMFDVIIGDYD